MTYNVKQATYLRETLYLRCQLAIVTYQVKHCFVGLKYIFSIRRNIDIENTLFIIYCYFNSRLVIINNLDVNPSYFIKH